MQGGSDMTGAARSLIEAISLDEIVRIDIGYEGDWSGSVVTVWTREHGLLGFDGVPDSYSDHIPSAELYFDGAWVGVHCYRTEGGRNVFDRGAALDLVRHVEARIAR
jgi:hypothetical protein